MVDTASANLIHQKERMPNHKVFLFVTSDVSLPSLLPRWRNKPVRRTNLSFPTCCEEISYAGRPLCDFQRYLYEKEDVCVQSAMLAQLMSEDAATIVGSIDASSLARLCRHNDGLSVSFAHHDAVLPNTTTINQVVSCFQSDEAGRIVVTSPLMTLLETGHVLIEIAQRGTAGGRADVEEALAILGSVIEEQGIAAYIVNRPATSEYEAAPTASEHLCQLAVQDADYLSDEAFEDITSTTCISKYMCSMPQVALVSVYTDQFEACDTPEEEILVSKCNRNECSIFVRDGVAGHLRVRLRHEDGLLGPAIASKIAQREYDAFDGYGRLISYGLPPPSAQRLRLVTQATEIVCGKRLCRSGEPGPVCLQAPRPDDPVTKLRRVREHLEDLEAESQRRGDDYEQARAGLAAEILKEEAKYCYLTKELEHMEDDGLHCDTLLSESAVQLQHTEGQYHDALPTEACEKYIASFERLQDEIRPDSVSKS